MAILSLNEAYEKDTIKYLCNTCGDVNDPKDPGNMKPVEAESVMTVKELVLYRRYWEEGSGCSMYVMRVNGEPAMGLGFLFDDVWCQTLFQKKYGEHKVIEPDDMEDYWMPRLYRAVEDAANALLWKKAPGCNVYVGKNTDPEGHEILVVVPYDLREEIKNIADTLNECVYETVEELF